MICILYGTAAGTNMSSYMQLKSGDAATYMQRSVVTNSAMHCCTTAVCRNLCFICNTACT